MQRASRVLVAVVTLVAASALPACAKSKAQDTPAAIEAGAAPNVAANAASSKLCSDGRHRRGDHWKVDCNPCRCGADGTILCSQFPCAERPAADASPPSERDH